MRQALALRYRPKRFEDLIGQETISQTLSLALTHDRLAHAYLFSGLRGSGKTSTARIFAKALMCDHGPTPQPCDACENCLMANEGRHIDIIEMDAASNRKIDDIRELIEHARYKPTIGRFKIFIIDEVHMLTKEAFNALLKTLEEPPASIKFILATTDPLKLPPTILSRTQHFRFKKIAPTLISRHLASILNHEGISYEAEALELLARSGSGSLRDTITLLDQAIVYCKGHIERESLATMLGIVNPTIIEELFELVFAHDRAALMSKIPLIEEFDPETLLDETIAYVKEKTLHGDPRFSLLIVERFFKILAQAKEMLPLNVDSGFLMALTFLKMVEASRFMVIDHAIVDLEKELFSPTKPSVSAPLASKPDIPLATPITPALTSKPSKTLFEKLQEAIYNRNYELGSCFSQAVTFVSFEENVLTWESRADENCKKLLRDYWGVIRQLVQETFGIETTIKGLTLPPLAPSVAPVPREDNIEDDAPQSYSTLSDIELGPSSCIAGEMTAMTPEVDATAILDDPLVKKAQELFEPKKITIIAKV